MQNMAWVLGAFGVLLAFLAFRQPRDQRSNWGLAALALLAIAYTYQADGNNPARPPSFAAREAPKNEGSALGGRIRYSELRWEEEGEQKYVLGKVQNTDSAPYGNMELMFEFFDAAGNSLGFQNQAVPSLSPGQSLEFRLEVTLPNARSFRFHRLNFL